MSVFGLHTACLYTENKGFATTPRFWLGSPASILSQDLLGQALQINRREALLTHSNRRPGASGGTLAGAQQ